MQSTALEMASQGHGDDDGRDMVADSAANLIDIWGDLAPSEALTRALVAERNENRDMAIRWVKVYLNCVERG